LKTPTLAITIGDPAGIGPEIVRKALLSKDVPCDFNYIIFGDRSGVRLGRPSRASAQKGLDALQQATEFCLEGKCQGIVTAPVCKETLSNIGFKFPGQTEFLADACGLHQEAVTMAMVGPTLRVFLLTTHVSLREAIDLIDETRLKRTILHARACLKKLGIRNPRIAVAGLNPHAGENGVIGTEEKKLIAPLIKKITSTIAGKPVCPILSADTLFYFAQQGRYDGVICLYHDQGLIPFKLVSFETGVNCTLGLPFPRTSPDHGTAFDIAGKDVASERSMVEAIRLALLLVKNGKKSAC